MSIFNIEELRRMLLDTRDDMQDTATGEFLQIVPFVINELERLQKKNIENINRNLEFMLTERLEDGTPILEVVFAQSPELKTKLREALRHEYTS